MNNINRMMWNITIHQLYPPNSWSLDALHVAQLRRCAAKGPAVAPPGHQRAVLGRNGWGRWGCCPRRRRECELKTINLKISYIKLAGLTGKTFLAVTRPKGPWSIKARRTHRSCLYSSFTTWYHLQKTHTQIHTHPTLQVWNCELLNSAWWLRFLLLPSKFNAVTVRM